MSKQFFLMLLTVAASASMQVHADRWRVLLYMDATDGLADMAFKNITDALRVCSNDQIDFCIQLHAYDDIALRYYITEHGLSYAGQISLKGDSKEDLIAASAWAFEQYDAGHTMLIFWNHGWGILDPVWNESEQKWESEAQSLHAVCQIKRSQLWQHEKQHHKGFMFSVTPRTYLNNLDMDEALGYITQHHLQGNKIDIVAFDTCMGGMLEVACQVAPYAHYLVGSQVCSLRDGFNYEGILSALRNGPKPLCLAQEMVRIFDEYYTVHDTDGIYAHTALDLKQTGSVVNALNEVVVRLLLCNGIDAALQAHKETPRFCIYPMYTDLVAYIRLIEQQYADNQGHKPLLDAMHQFYEKMHSFVIARCAGSSNDGKTHGCAVYVPQYTIDKTYTNSIFVQQSRWFTLLQAVAQQVNVAQLQQ